MSNGIRSEVGKDKYLSGICKGTIYEGIHITKSSKAFTDRLTEIGKNAALMLDAIYDDVEMNKQTFRFIDSNRVSEIKKISNQLYEVARFLSASTRRSTSDIENKMKTLSLSSKYNIRDVERVAAGVTKNSGTSVVSSELLKAALAYNSYNKHSSNKGKNGEILGTQNYNDAIMKRVFCDGFCRTTNYDPTKCNKTLIQTQTESLINRIRSDIRSKHHTDEYIEYNERERILSIGNSLLSYCSSNVINGLDKELKMLQRLEDFNHKVISIDKRGFSYRVNAKLCWEKGKNILYLSAQIFFTFLNPIDGLKESLNPNATDPRKQSTLSAFQKWDNGENEYRNIFVDQSVRVVMSLNETNSAYNAVEVYLDMPGQYSIGWGGVGLIDWNVKSDKFIFLSDPNDPNGTATHELGHILGLGDAYKTEYIPVLYYGEGVDETKYPDAIDSVMKDYTKSPTSNDIEMVIYAFYTGNRQDFQVETPWHSISPVLGR